MMENNSHDVIVIGGGPAGSTAATWLSRLGHMVLLLEREKFAGTCRESLLPFFIPSPDFGVVDELKTISCKQRPFIGRDGKGYCGTLTMSSR